MDHCTDKNQQVLWYYSEKFCSAALIFLTTTLSSIEGARRERKSERMCPCTLFPLGTERVRRIGIQTSPHPRRDPNYRCGLCPSESTFLQMILWSACIFSRSKTNKKHIHILNRSQWETREQEREQERWTVGNRVGTFWFEFCLRSTAPCHVRENPILTILTILSFLSQEL